MQAFYFILVMGVIVVLVCGLTGTAAILGQEVLIVVQLLEYVVDWEATTHAGVTASTRLPYRKC